ncbi:MAG: hypothetical protein E7028_10025 [Planctomycetaceae bacterium]|nr:hypothetical protein [Planctomycetaceae bacterium]
MKKTLRNTILGLTVTALFISGTLCGCGKKAPPIPASRLDFLEIEVAEQEKYIQEAEAKYLEERAKLEAANDSKGVRLLDTMNRERLRNEKQILKKQQKELEKLRQSEANKK